MNAKKEKSGVNKYSEQIKEVSIKKNFPKEKEVKEDNNFLYCDPAEVILQSKH